MKKYIILFMLSIFIMLSACNNATVSNPKNENLYIQTYNVTSFNLQEFIKENNVDYKYFCNVGEIESAIEAVEKAKKLWDKEFGKIAGTYYDPTGGRKIDIAFDENSDCWLLSGTLPDDTFGTVPVALIKSNGDVMAIYMPGLSIESTQGDG